MATDLAQQAGERTNAVASWLEEREPGHVVDEITRFARQRPGAFLAAAAGAGFLVGRLGRGLKAATDESDDSASRILVHPRSRRADTSPPGVIASRPATPGPGVPPHRATTPADTNPHPATNSRRHRAPPPSRPGYPQGPSGRDLAP